MSTKDDALIEKMAFAYVGDRAISVSVVGLQDALTIARKAILEEAAQTVRNLQCDDEDDFDEGYNAGCVDAEAAIRSLADLA